MRKTQTGRPLEDFLLQSSGLTGSLKISSFFFFRFLNIPTIKACLHVSLLLLQAILEDKALITFTEIGFWEGAVPFVSQNKTKDKFQSF